jgi:hypothetical protein
LSLPRGKRSFLGIKKNFRGLKIIFRGLEIDLQGLTGKPDVIVALPLCVLRPLRFAGDGASKWVFSLKKRISAMPDYLPSRESELVTWSNNFATQIAIDPPSIGLTAGQATTFGTLRTAFVTSYATANDPTTDSSSATAAKKAAKDAMVNGPGGIRQLVKIIQAFPGTTNTQRVDLGIRVPDEDPTPAPIPDQAPLLQIEKTLGRVVTMNLRDSVDRDRRGKPDGVSGATILMYVGEDAPLDPMQWIFLANTTRTTVEMDFAPSVAPGAKVWLIAFWRNRRDEAGPAAVPVSVRLGDSMAMAA